MVSNEGILPAGKMYSSFPGSLSNADSSTLKFFARTDLGVWLSQSVSCEPDPDTHARTHGAIEGIDVSARTCCDEIRVSSHQERRIFAECAIIKHLQCETIRRSSNDYGKNILTSRNSVPSADSFVACRLWGIPGGKYQRSPGCYEQD